MLGWLLFIVFVLLAIFKSPWWWIPTVVLGLQRVFVWRRHRKPWWRIHDEALNLYTRSAAYEQAAAEREGRAFDVLNAIALMVKQIHPDWEKLRIMDFVLHQLGGLRRANTEAVVERFLVGIGTLFCEIQ